MFLDKKTLYFLWYLLEFDLDELITEKEKGRFFLNKANLTAEDYLALKIASIIDVNESLQERDQKRKLFQSENHIKKKYSYIIKT